MNKILFTVNVIMDFDILKSMDTSVYQSSLNSLILRLSMNIFKMKQFFGLNV